MKLFLIGLLFTLNMAIAQRENTIPGDCLRIGTAGECITQAEFDTLDGASANLQQQIDDVLTDISDTNDAVDLKANDDEVLHLTGDESASGVKTFTGKIAASSTSNGFTPCPVMTSGQRDSIVGAAAGDCIYNSTLSTLNVYNGTVWKSAGGGVNQWATAIAYLADDVVIQSNKLYICLLPHTSGTFSTDLSGGNWQLLNAKVDVSTDISGILPLANGGSNKALTASNGAIAYSDADSVELLAPGTSGQILQTNGAATPSFVNKSISGKAENASSVTVEEIQVPNNLLTATDTNKYLHETGNNNILANPSFEHSTFSTSWTLTAGSSASESTKVVHGKKSYKATLSAQTLALYQDSTLYASQFAGAVQGVAMARVNTTVSGIFVCPRQAGATQLSNCVQVDSSGTWGLYKVPFVLGATSNGVAIVSGTLSSGLVTVGNVTGDVYVDDAFVAAANIIDTQPIIGPEVSYTPTVTSFGSTSGISFVYRQSGSKIEVTGTFTAGTATAALGTITIPSQFTLNATALGLSNTSANAGPIVGEYSCTGSTNSGYLVTAAGTSTTNIYFGNVNSGSGTNIPTNANSLATAGVCSIKFKVPVNELRGSTNTYTAPCGASCVDEFTATVTSGGVVTEDTYDWLNGNASLSDTSLYTFTPTLGYFTVTPKCEAFPISGSTGVGAQIEGSITSSSIPIRTHTNGSTKTASAFQLRCKRVGADFVASRTIHGDFKNVVTTPGTSRQVLVSANIPTSGVVVDDEDNFINGTCAKSGTNNAITTCTFTTNYWAATPKCWTQVWTDSGAVITVVKESESTSSVVFTTRLEAVGGNRAIDLFCKGQKQ